MNIKFNKIIIKNFLSIGEAEIYFNDSGYTLVKGINNNIDDLASSNGSGKSSLFEAICWCLTGETIRGIKSDISNINSNDGAVVDLYLEVSGDTWRILRSKDNKQYKTTLKLYINDLDKSGKGIRDTSKILQELLPDLTSELIGSVIILGQGLPQRFSSNTPSGRKEVLEKLSKSDFMIDNLKNRVINRKTYLLSRLRFFEDKILECDSKLSLTNQNLDSCNKDLSNLKNEDEINEDINKLELDIKFDDENLANFSFEKIKVDKEINDLRLKYSDLSKTKSIKNLDLTNKKLKEKSILDENKNKETKELQLELDRLSFNIDKLNEEIKKIDSIKDICPTCGQKLIGVEKPSTKELKVDLKNNIKQQAKLQKKLDIINENYNKQFENLENTYSDLLNNSLQYLDDELLEITEKGKHLKNVLNDLNNSIEQLTLEHEEHLTKLHNLKLDLAKLEYTKKSLLDDLESLKTDKVNLEEKKMYNIKEKELVESRLEIIAKFNTAISRDFRGYLLNNVINYINSKAKEYSKYVFDTDKIDFVLDGNNINICYCNKQYENLSGGERQKVDLIVQFSIRDMLCKFLNFSCNVLIVDEIFDNLDSIGCQRVINLISTKLQDISNIFIVTHRADLEIPYDREIIVEKDSKGISRIQ